MLQYKGRSSSVKMFLFDLRLHVNFFTEEICCFLLFLLLGISFPRLEGTSVRVADPGMVRGRVVGGGGASRFHGAQLHRC